MNAAGTQWDAGTRFLKHEAYLPYAAVPKDEGNAADGTARASTKVAVILVRDRT
jgi:hypothetical protein